MLVKVEIFIFLDDFVILDGEVDFKVCIIFVRPFLETSKTLVDVQSGELNIF